MSRQKIAVIPWGFHTWHAMHYVALGYPDAPSQKDVDDYRTFFTSLGPVLPCKMCTGHYAEHLKTHPIDAGLASRAALFEWTVTVHNAVNKSLGRREWGVDEARAYLLSLAVPIENGGAGAGATSTADVKYPPKEGGGGGRSWWPFVALLVIVAVLLVVVLMLVGGVTPKAPDWGPRPQAPCPTSSSR